MPFFICCWPSDWREVQQAWVPGIPKQQSSCTPILIHCSRETRHFAPLMNKCCAVVFDAGRNNKAALVECIVFVGRAHLVQLSNGIFLLKRVSRYGRCFMIDSGSKGCPEQESAGCHFSTLGRNFLRAKTKWPPNISRSNMIFQLMEPGTSVIPHFYVILTEQSISCIILMTQGHLQGQKDNFKVKEAKIQFLTNKDRNMCNTSFTWDFI